MTKEEKREEIFSKIKSGVYTKIQGYRFLKALLGISLKEAEALYKAKNGPKNPTPQ